MRIERVAISGFGRYDGDVEVDFTELGPLVAIVGPNGAGKSTLLDAIAWALFGVGRSSDVDDVICLASDEATVAVTISMGDETYVVARKRRRGKGVSVSIKHLLADGTDETVYAGSVRGGDEFLRSLIGISWEQASASVFAAQGDVGHFAEASAAERRALLGSLLGLEVWDELVERATAEAARIRVTTAAATARRDEAAALAGRRDDLLHARSRLVEMHQRAELGRDVVRAEAEKISQRSAEVSAALAALAEARRSLTAAEATAKQTAEHNERAVSMTRRRHQQAASLVGDLERHLSSVGQAEQRVANAETDLEAARQEEATAQQRLSEAEAAWAEARSVVALGSERVKNAEAHVDEVRRAVEAGSCFVCGSALDAEAGRGLLAEASADLERSRLLAEQASAEAASAKQERDEAMRSAKEAQKKVEGCARAAESARTSLAEARMAIGRLEEARRAEREAEAAVADAETLAAQASEAADAELTALRAHVRDLETAAAPAKEVAERAREVGERLRQAEAEVVERAAELAARERDLAAAEEAVIRLGEIEAELARLSERGQLAQVLIKAAGPSGVPALVVASSVGELEETANDVLDRLSHGTMRLGIRCSRPSKSRSGASVETLDVVLADLSGAERAWATWSGGERFRADLALRIALARVVAARSAVEAPRWLVIDEGFGALDDDGVATFGNVLADLSKEVDLVLAVTHSPEVAQLFPRRLEVRPGWPALEVA